MSTLKEYKKKMREMFFISVDKDIDQWKNPDSNNYVSPSYGQKNECHLNIDTSKGILYFYNGEYINICRYSFLFIPIDIKVWRYRKKISNHFYRLNEEYINSKEINRIKGGLEEIQKNYIKEVRKEKLNNIDESK